MLSKWWIVFLILFFSFQLSAQSWEQRASHPGDPRHHPATFVIDGLAYLLTGSTETTNTKDFYRYDPTTDEWSTLPDFPGEARSFSYAVSNNGKGYLGFGVSNTDYLNDLWEYDAETGVWTELASCPCTKRAHPAFVVQDDKIFVGLGNYTSNLKDWWEYNIETDSWRQLPDLPGPERHHPYHFAVGGSVYVGLGHGAGMTIYQDWYRWDLSSETWEIMQNLPAEARVAGTQLNSGDRGFILSGDGDDHSTMETGEFWEYDYMTDSWSSLPAHPGVSRWAPGSFVIGDTVYFTSGEVRQGNPDAGLKNDLWRFALEGVASNESIESNQTEVVAYPNPANDWLSIDGLQLEKDVKLQIYDASGKMLKSMNYTGAKVDISSFAPGFYFVSILQENKVLDRIKFMKE
jgi:N-acetylneuraminic acid mutarotase